MERILLLVKLDYMSRDNFGLIRAAKSREKFKWAYILQSKFVMDVKGIDKRRKSRVSKIAPFLFKMFDFANKNNVQLVLSKSHTTAKASKGKKAQSGISLGDDEPPSKRGKANTIVAEASAEVTKEGKLKPEIGVLDEMVNMGFDLKDVKARVKENWGGIMKEEMFLTPFKDMMKQPTQLV